MKRKVNFSGVEDTLYIPLTARIYASRKFPEFFYDEKALMLEKYLPTNDIEKNSTEYFLMASVCRQYVFDRKITNFLKENLSANVVFLGAGLETSYHRLGNTEAAFYQVDLPPVMAVRKRLLGNGENEKLIAGDMFTFDWLREVNVSLPTLVVVSGVYQYFNKSKVVAMIRQMKELLSAGELVFDATSSAGLKTANSYVRKSGNTQAPMLFSVDDPTVFAAETGSELIAADGFFDDALRYCKGLTLKTRIYMYLADKLCRTKILHLRFPTPEKEN